jgi:hypothetical protein
MSVPSADGTSSSITVNRPSTAVSDDGPGVEQSTARLCTFVPSATTRMLERVDSQTLLASTESGNVSKKRHPREDVPLMMADEINWGY